MFTFRLFFFFFPVKVKLCLGRLLVSENRYECRSFVRQSGGTRTFEEQEELCQGRLGVGAGPWDIRCGIVEIL